MKILKIFGFLLVLELAFVVHEYGHFSEMRKRNIPVAEFSLGIGWVLYQHNISSGTVVNLRAIPIMAYVAPTEDGNELFKQKPLWDKFVIYSAGVRNNLIFAIALILLMQLLACWRGNLDYVYLVRNLFLYPLAAPLIFLVFTLDMLTFGCISFKNPLKFITCLVPPNWLKTFINLSLLIGFWNFVPLYPLDGGQFLLEIIVGALNSGDIGLIKFISQIIAVFFMINGTSRIKLVDYPDQE